MSDNRPLCPIVPSLLDVSSIRFSTLFSQVHLLHLLLLCSADSQVIASALWISDSKYSPRVTSSMSFFSPTIMTSKFMVLSLISLLRFRLISPDCLFILLEPASSPFAAKVILPSRAMSVA